MLVERLRFMVQAQKIRNELSLSPGHLLSLTGKSAQGVSYIVPWAQHWMPCDTKCWWDKGIQVKPAQKTDLTSACWQRAGLLHTHTMVSVDSNVTLMVFPKLCSVLCIF